MNSYLKEISDGCDIKKKMTFHTARHTFATTVTLTNGVPIETVSKMLGHRNLKTIALCEDPGFEGERGYGCIESEVQERRGIARLGNQ